VKLSAPPVIALLLTAPSPSIAPASVKNSDTLESLIAIEPVNCAETDPQKPQSVEQGKSGVGAIFSSTFFTIFLAEMGDKTQLATLLMSAESQSPWVVFAGAATALIATSLLGVLIGRWIANRLSPKAIETSAGALLLFISVMLLWDVVSF